MNNQGVENLCNAVVIRAVTDYRKGLRMLAKNPNSEYAERIISDCERFFKDEIALYTRIDGETIMKRIKEEVRNENIKR